MGGKPRGKTRCCFFWVSLRTRNKNGWSLPKIRVGHGPISILGHGDSRVFFFLSFFFPDGNNRVESPQQKADRKKSTGKRRQENPHPWRVPLVISAFGESEPFGGWCTWTFYGKVGECGSATISCGSNTGLLFLPRLPSFQEESKGSPF